MKHLQKITLILFSSMLLLFTIKQDLFGQSSLDEQLQSVVSHFDGRSGIYLYHFESNSEIAINADDLYTSASMIKIPIMAKLFDMIEKGELDYNSILTWTGEPKYQWEDDFVNVAKVGSEFRLSRLIFLMIALSDNTSSLWLQRVAGEGIEINKWLEANGYEHTRVNSRTEGREEDYKKYGWGQTTPREMATLMREVYEGKVVSQRASDKMYRFLTKSYWDGESLSAIPKNVLAASKQGAVSQSKSEVIFVHSPGGTYVLCSITDNQSIEGYEYDNPGYVFLRKVSSIVYNYYNQDNTYKPKEPNEWWD